MFPDGCLESRKENRANSTFNTLSLFLKTIKLLHSFLKYLNLFAKPSFLLYISMQFSLATIIACATALCVFFMLISFHKNCLTRHRTAARDHGYHDMMKKHITCPTAGGTATISHPCHTGPPPTSILKHPHSKPTSAMEHTKSEKWDGTVTVYPSDAPEVTVTPGIDCQGETGPSCALVTFASPTCSLQPHETGEHHKADKTYKSFPTITASAGAVKTVHAKHTATCK